MATRLRFLSALVGFLILTTLSLAQNGVKTGSWPQFRGPGGQGQVAGQIPQSWSEGDLAWQVPIAGKGWSSPVISDGKIWLTTSVPDKKNKDDKKVDKNGRFSLRAMAFDAATGKTSFDGEVFALEKGFDLHARNTLATPTPVLENGKVYLSFGSAGFACLDAATGKTIWKNDSFKLDYKTGAASSPILYKDKLIVSCDAADQQFALALDKATGEIAWKKDRPEALTKNDDSRRAFSTPLVITVDGKDQVVMPGAFCVYSYDPSTGEELWRVKYGGFSNVPRPIFAHGLVYVQTGFAPPDLIAIRPDGTGDVTKSHIAWRVKKNVPNIPSPVIIGDNLYMVSDGGFFTCLDAKTGGLKYSERLGSNFSASLLTNGKTIYAFSDDGKTFLIEPGDAYKEIGRNELPIKMQASPAVVDGAMFLRSENSLIKVGGK